MQCSCNMKGERSQVFFFTALSTNKFPMLDNGIIGKVRTLFTMTVVPGRNVSPALFPEEVVADKFVIVSSCIRFTAIPVELCTCKV